MCEYRVYFLDERDHVRRAADIDAEDDDAVLAEIARLADPGAPIEVWRLDRFLCRFDPLPTPRRPQAEERRVAIRADGPSASPSSSADRAGPQTPA